MGAKAIKLGLWEKILHTAKIGMLVCGICTMEINMMGYFFFKPGE